MQSIKGVMWEAGELERWRIRINIVLQQILYLTQQINALLSD